MLREWECLVKKIVDFGNHQRFTLKCLDYGFIPISCMIKNPIRIPKRYDIIKGAERVRNINNSLGMLCVKRNTYRNQVAASLDNKHFGECPEFMTRIRKARYLNNQTRQSRMFDRLGIGGPTHTNINMHTVSAYLTETYKSSAMIHAMTTLKQQQNQQQ